MNNESSEWVGYEEFVMRNGKVVPRGTFRKIIYAREKNGASSFVRKVGKRLLLSQKKFEEWVDAQKSK